MNVVDTTTGMVRATTTPVRKPRDAKLTSNTMAMASNKDCEKSPMDSLTICGWLDT